MTATISHRRKGSVRTSGQIPGRRFGAAKRVIGTALLATLALSLVACARPTGDFGRAQPDLLHDEVMPAAGKLRAEWAGEPVSTLNLADAEREMADRVWRFLIAPQAGDNVFDRAAERQRTRITPPTDTQFSPARYYGKLQGTNFQSSTVRYNAVRDDIQADLLSLPQTFAVICRVVEIDRQRAIAAGVVAGAPVGEVADRRAENGATIAWFVRALSYRVQSYDYALDQLLVETPDPAARQADAKLQTLTLYASAAAQGRFCGDPGAAVAVVDGKRPLPRVLMSAPDEGPYKK